MNLFNYLMAKKGHNTSVIDDLFSFLLGKKSSKILPDGYTQVDYIESDGTQYIDSGVKLGFNSGFDIKYLTKSDNTTTYGDYGCIFGGRDGSNVNDYQLTTFSTNNYGTLRWGTNYQFPAYIEKNTIQSCSLINHVFTAPNGTTTTLSVESSTTQYNAYLFGLNVENYLNQTGKGCRIYYLKFYDNNTLIRDFIPCYRNSDNEVGLYDIVNNVFYTNQGTGEFTYE